MLKRIRNIRKSTILWATGLVVTGAIMLGLADEPTPTNELEVVQKHGFMTVEGADLPTGDEYSTILCTVKSLESYGLEGDKNEVACENVLDVEDYIITTIEDATLGEHYLVTFEHDDIAEVKQANIKTITMEGK